MLKDILCARSLLRFFQRPLVAIRCFENPASHKHFGFNVSPPCGFYASHRVRSASAVRLLALHSLRSRAGTVPGVESTHHHSRQPGAKSTNLLNSRYRWNPDHYRDSLSLISAFLKMMVPRFLNVRPFPGVLTNHEACNPHSALCRTHREHR
jgi:hypothetical protein